MATVGWLWAVVKRRDLELDGFGTALVAICVIAVPIEVLFAVATGRGYRHYYLTWLPSMAGLAAYFAFVASRRLAELGVPEGLWLGMSRTAVLTLVLSLTATTGPIALIARGSSPTADDLTRGDAIAFVKSHTAESERVLIWGAAASINYESGRMSPTRFVYQYALFTPGYRNEELFASFLNDMRGHPPAMLVDAALEGDGSVMPPLDSARYERLTMLRMIEESTGAHYQLVTTVGPSRWPIYARAPAP